MSIYHQILDHVNDGRLFRVLSEMPRVRGAPFRQLFVSESVNELLVGPWTDADWEIRCGRLRADFDSFTDGEFVVPVSFKKYGGSLLKRLVPNRDEIWEIRSCDPLPQLRVFGRFAELDVFVALTWAARSDLGDHLTREGMEAWRRAAVQCGTDWRVLFPTYEPLSGVTNHDYLSNSFLV